MYFSDKRINELENLVGLDKIAMRNIFILETNIYEGLDDIDDFWFFYNWIFFINNYKYRFIVYKNIFGYDYKLIHK